jgi:LysM repeat protein
MDTISRENNSVLPLAGVIVGVVGLLLGAYATFSLPKIKQQLATQEEKLSHQDDIAAQASAAASKADSANARIDSVAKGTNDAFQSVATELGNEKAAIAKLEESLKRPLARHGKHGDVVAGPGEYIVKHGDSGRRIARANGCSLADLQAVNPGVNWARLKVGQKIKLPEGKAEAAAAPAAAPAPAQ